MAVISAQHAARARTVLREIVADYGPAILSSPAQMTSLLSDLLPEAPGVARMLVAAAEEHVADQLRDRVSSGLDGATATRAVAMSFADKTLYAPEACTWIVGQIAGALGLTSGSGHAPVVVAPPSGPTMSASPADEPPSAVPPTAYPAQVPRSPATGQAGHRGTPGVAGQIPGEVSGRPPLSTRQKRATIILIILGTILLPVGLIALPGALVATYLDRPLTRRNARRILAGYGIFWFAIAIIYIVYTIVKSHYFSHAMLIDRGPDFALGLGYLIAGLCIRQKIARPSP